MLRPWGPALLALATLCPVVGRAADSITIVLHTTGDLVADGRGDAAVDLGHFCSVAADPWERPAEPPDTRPPPFPFYRVIFGQAAAGSELDRPGPSMDLAVSNWKLGDGQEAHGDPQDDAIEVVIKGRQFVGHASADPSWKFSVRFDATGEGGSFTAGPLHETGTAHGMISVDGTWNCPPVVARPPQPMPAAASAKAPLPARVVALVPAKPPAPPVTVRLSIRGKAWQAEETGKHPYLPFVDISALHLAPALRREVFNGHMILMVEAEVYHGPHAKVTALRLVGTEPRGP